MAIEQAADGLDLVELAVVRGAFDKFRRNDAAAFGTRIDQRMLTKKIDDAGNAARIGVNGSSGFWVKDRLCSARSAKARLNVG